MLSSCWCHLYPVCCQNLKSYKWWEMFPPKLSVCTSYNNLQLLQAKNKWVIGSGVLSTTHIFNLQSTRDNDMIQSHSKQFQIKCERVFMLWDLISNTPTCSCRSVATRFEAANQRKHLEFKQQNDQIKFGILYCFSFNEFDIMRCERMQRLYKNDTR